jgi:putative ribosome biogenesis GTPase RsgA
MTLRIVTADQRLAEANGKTTVALFGPSGVGKTSQPMSTQMADAITAFLARRVQKQELRP